MIAINELRRLALDGELAAMQEIILRLEAAEKSDAESLAMYRKARDERDALRDALRHEADCVEAAKAEIEALHTKIAEMEKQEPFAWIARGGYPVPLDTLEWQLWYGPEKPTLSWVNQETRPLYALPGAQQCRNYNGMGDRFDPSGEKIPCDLCESNFEEIRVLVAEAAHDIISGGDFWLSTSLAAKKIYALPGAKGEKK